MNPQRAEIRYDLGKILSAQDNYPPAKRELEEAIRLDPSYMEAYDALGFVMESMGDDNAALSHYRKAVELSETRKAGFASPYVNLAAHYNRLGDSKLAAEHARNALRVIPSPMPLTSNLRRRSTGAGVAESGRSFGGSHRGKPTGFFLSLSA